MRKLLSQLLGGAGKSASLPSLSPKEALILELLARGEKYGLELVACSNGELKRGTVYVTLGRLEEKGFVRSRAERSREGAAGLPRRLYKPTAAGASALRAWEQLATALSALRNAENAS